MTDAYPTKPIRLVEGFPVGGATDFLDRVIGPKLTENLGQPVIVDNRPGAASNLAASMVARAEPDGYTLFMAASTAVAPSPSLYSKLGYDLMTDFAYVSLRVPVPWPSRSRQARWISPS